MAIHQSILETIGGTPVVRVNRLAPEGVELYVKVEAFNPMGSVKDRMAWGIIRDAEASGALRPGQTVVEATSGNTGIGLAMVCAATGHPLVVVMAESFSLERRKMMRFLGARVVLTPAAAKGTGMVAKARDLAEEHGWFLCRQFENESNPDVHTRTTAREILADFEGERLDWWVTGFGTGGTLKGVSRVLRAERPEVRIAVCEPDNARILASGVRQERRDDGSAASSHPSWTTHPIQGWSADFVPKLAEDAADTGVVDRFLAVEGADAMECSRELARQEGIFTGISGGATFAGARRIAADAPAGTRILCMLPDTGERYLSTPLFDGIADDMSAEEQEISRSTPGYRFDIAAAAPLAAAVQPTPAAVRFVEEAVHDHDHPVVMFSFEWCEFCWSARKLLGRCGIPYRSIDIDSAENQRDGWGAKVRAALNERFEVSTIPQLFVRGLHIGGCSELFDAFRDGTLQRMLTDGEVEFDPTVTVDPYSLLPGWLHPR